MVVHPASLSATELMRTNCSHNPNKQIVNTTMLTKYIGGSLGRTVSKVLEVTCTGPWQLHGAVSGRPEEAQLQTGGVYRASASG